MHRLILYTTPHLISWDWRVAADLFLGGIGVGAFLVAVFFSFAYRDKYSSVSKAGAVIAPLAVILGLCFLLSEMGHPFRLYQTLIGFNLSSPISWGGPLQGLFIVIGLIYAYLWLKPGQARLRNLVGAVGVPAALAVGAYHGWLLTAVKARPLWNTAGATITALLGLVTTGVAAVLLAVCLTRRGTSEGTPENKPACKCPIERLRNLLIAGLFLQCVAFIVWWAGMSAGTDLQGEAIATANAAMGMLFWAAGIGVGLVIPAFLQIADILAKRREDRRASIPTAAFAAILTLIGGFVLRYVVIIAGQMS